MFGFLRPGCPSLRYRSAYSRCCQHLRHHYGVRSLPFHGYESVFLYVCAVDAGYVPAELIREQRCCRMRREADLADSADADLGRFVGATALTLADIKLADDEVDDRSRSARLYRRILRTRVQDAHRVLARADPSIDGKIRGWLREHAALEAGRGPVALDDYCAPTAEAFAHVFGLVGKVAGSDSFGQQVREIFHDVGAALIAFDCASDWRADRDSGGYNPLRDPSEIPEAYAFSARSLDSAIGRCRSNFGEGSLGASVLASVAGRVRSLASRASETPSGPSTFQACANSAEQIPSEMGKRFRHQTKPGYLYADWFLLAFPILGIMCCFGACWSGWNQQRRKRDDGSVPPAQGPGCFGGSNADACCCCEVGTRGCCEAGSSGACEGAGGSCCEGGAGGCCEGGACCGA